MTELLIASVLSLAFAGVVATVLASASGSARDSIVKGSLEQKARDINDTMIFFLRGAGPPGVCLDPDSPLGWPLSDCLSVAEAPASFAAASPTSLTFYSYATQLGDDATAEVLAVPDKVVFREEGRRILILRYAPKPSATYTSPSWETVPEVVRDIEGGSPGGEPLFSYFDSSGAPLAGVSGVLPDADLSRIALVEFRPRISQVVGDETRTAGLDSAVSVARGGA